jgi:hypothetical protein
MHLAQLNIGRLRGTRDDAHMAGFFDNLDRVNAIAERMPGFVWRLKDDSNNATNIPFPGAENMAVNLSVWESVEALETFVWKTVHAQIYAQKTAYFEPHAQPHFVMWWVDEGHMPSLEEAKDRLDHYTAHGADDFAFGWADLPAAKLWQTRRCA